MIVCVPLDSPRVLYLRHHGAHSSGWTVHPYASSVPNTINLKPTLSYPRARPPNRASAMCVSGNPIPCEV